MALLYLVSFHLQFYFTLTLNPNPGRKDPGRNNPGRTGHLTILGRNHSGRNHSPTFLAVCIITTSALSALSAAYRPYRPPIGALHVVYTTNTMYYIGYSHVYDVCTALSALCTYVVCTTQSAMYSVVLVTYSDVCTTFAQRYRHFAPSFAPPISHALYNYVIYLL